MRVRVNTHKTGLSLSSAFHGRTGILLLNVLNIFIAVISIFFRVCFPSKTFTSVFMHSNLEIIFQIL